MGMFDKWKKRRQDISATDAAGESSAPALGQADENTGGIAARLGYSCQIFPAGTDYEEVLKAYEEALLEGQRDGFTPVLVPADDTLEEYLGILKEDGLSLEAVLKSELESGEKVLQRRFEEYFEGNAMEDICEFEEEPETVDRYTAFQDYRTGKTLETALLKIPTVKPWELVAYVPFGGWNECPDAKEMMAVCKYWFEKYGAVPVTISHDVMEMRVPSPVQGKESMQVAKEHFAFDPDRVDQCTRTGSLAELAACIAASDIWYFWWD